MEKEIFVESESEEGVFYKVKIVNIKECSCKGFKFKGTCKHIDGLENGTIQTIVNI